MVMPTNAAPNDGEIKIAFDMKTHDLRGDMIMPIRPITPKMKSGQKYKQILTSIKAIGLIEPLAVSEDKNLPDHYILLDGHMRLEALKEIGTQRIPCLICKDDESYSYNKYFNRLPPLEQHRMILNALKNGVTEEELAEKLVVDVKRIILKRDILKGICKEALKLLEKFNVPETVLQALKKMKPMRQIDAANLMISANCFTITYMNALLVGTSPDDMVDSEKNKKMGGLKAEQIEKLRNEITVVERDYKLLSNKDGTDTIKLTFGKAYICKLLKNSRVHRYLGKNYEDLLVELEKIAAMTSIGAREIEQIQEN